MLYRNIIPIRTGARKRAALKRALPPNQSPPDVWQHTLRVVFQGMLDLFDNWFSIVVFREELKVTMNDDDDVFYIEPRVQCRLRLMHIQSADAMLWVYGTV